MSGTKALLDSNIIIYLSKSSLDPSELFKDYSTIPISRISYMEVLGFAFKEDSEMAIVNKLLETFGIYELNKKIADEAIRVRKEKKLNLPDSIIYATAKVNKCDLITADEDFIKKLDNEVNVINPIF